MTHLTPGQKTTKAKKFFIGALYHSVFYDRTSRQINTQMRNETDGVSPTEAQILIANKMALLKMNADGTCSLSQTLHGAKKHGSNHTLRHDYDPSIVLGEYPRTRGHPPVDMVEVYDICCNYAYRFNLGKMY